MEPITFKFRLVDANGNETGFLSSKGEINEAELVLGKTVIPLNCMYQVVRRYNRLAVVYASDSGPFTLTIAVRGGLERKVKETIDRLCSYRWAENRHAQLIAHGKEAAFRTAKCRLCTAVVDLTGFRDTPQFYCYFCENLLRSDYEIELDMAQYRLCDRCGFYSRPTRFTVTYIIFNIIQWREHWCCHACIRRESWKMLFGNLLPPFVGIPFAVGLMVRAYGAGKMDPRFPELVGANAYANKGRLAEAEPLYQTMLERMPVQAGVRYNLALACARAKEWEQCLDGAQAALDDCSNYQPAANLVVQALQELNRSAEAEQFSQSWGQPSAAGPAGATDPHGASRFSEQIQRRPSARDDGISEGR